MVAELQNLKPRHRQVLRLLATGKYSLKQICEMYGLNYQSWCNISNSALFQTELKRLQEQLDDEFFEQELDDPIIAQARQKASAAVTTLVREMENTDPLEGASAATRIKASEKILGLSGYTVDGKKKDEDSGKMIIIQISGAKAELLSKVE